ncbi:AAA family ATPase [Acidaminococcus sp. HCP3S3_G9_1]|uniref:AAA family ATPase n=1 Tax=Acidaminococcus sp. HCP3S3_G9_1 TaxID=3438732 RepID=UPI003F8E7BDE
MKLLKLKLENFKGVREFSLDADGKNVAVYGSNGTGKSTLFDAFTWCLFGKNSKDEKDFGIKTRNAMGDEIPKMEHAVEMTVENKGRTMVLRREYKERWRKARGTDRAVYDGNTTDFYFGPVGEVLTKVPGRRYQEIVSSMIPEQLFKLLTDPLFFNEKLSWKERRSILTKVCGEVSDADVAAADPALAEVTAMAAGRSIDETRQALRQTIKKTSDARAECEPRADECRKAMKPLTAEEHEKAAAVDHLEKVLSDLQAQKASILAAGVQARLQSQKLSVENKIRELEAKREEAYRTEANEIQERLDAEQRTGTMLERKADDLMYKASKVKVEINHAEEQLQDLRKSWDDEYGIQFEGGEITTICPTCGQTMPEEKLQEAREWMEREEAAFNNQKAAKLKQINECGKKLTEQKQKLTEELKDLTDQAAALGPQLEESRKMVKAIQAKLTALEMPPAGNTEVALRNSLEKIEDQLAAGRPSHEAEDLDKEIWEANEQLKAAQQIRNYEDVNQKIQARIGELLHQGRELAQKQTDLERKLYLCDRFLRKKAEMVNALAAKKFKYVRFVMFKPNISNDGIEECCEASFQGVPYKDLNTGFRVNAGLDVINTLIDVYGEDAPIFFDNAESVTKLIPTKAQMIRLVVSEKDKTLRVEKEN